VAAGIDGNVSGVAGVTTTPAGFATGDGNEPGAAGIATRVELGYTCYAAAGTACGTLGCPRWGFPR
jgi:hypothetical protein